jgi:photosystem II stability/assembly factor-like uncharacterized protein
MRSHLFKITLALTVFALGLLFVVRGRKIEPRDSFAEREQAEASYAFESMRWYNAQRAYPTGHIPEDWRQKAYGKIRQNSLGKSSSATAITWKELGPPNIGGRVRSVAIDPTNSSIVYCGSVSGGIWKSTNAGGSWFQTSDSASNLVIGCIAIDPSTPSTIYAGTGEGYFNVDALRGAGVLKSTDAGATWTLLTNFAPPLNPSFSYYYINRLVIRPDNHYVFAGMLGGIWRTTNGGTNWTQIATGQTSVRCMDLIMDPTNYNIMYTTYGNFSRDGIYKTTNGGTNWSKLAVGLPTSGYYRINLGMAPSKPSIIYAVFDDSATHNTYGIYRTNNGGNSWSTVTNPHHLGGQGWYNNTVAVHPTDTNTVVIGGITLYKTTNGGTSWAQVSTTTFGDTHVDQHALVFDKVNVNTLYVGNDGGMYKSGNAGTSYSNINNNLSITQFYSGAFDPTETILYGGTQDNGTLKASGAAPTWSTVFGGDGGKTAVDFSTPTTVYTEYVNLCIQKSLNSGAGWARIMTGIPTSGSNQSDGTSDRCSFIAPYAMDPSNSQVLVAGTFKVYRTTNGGGSWTGISSDLTGDGDGSNDVANVNGKAFITAVAIAKTATGTIYVGTSGSGTVVSKVQVTTTTGGSWNDRTGTLPDLYAKSFAIDPANAAHAYVTYSGYGAGHVWVTTNTGLTWTNASGNLPDVPVNSIVIDPNNISHLIIGTDLGVFDSPNGGTNWTQRNSGLANVSVEELRIGSDAVLFAATHGRGMFKTQDPVAVHEQPGAVPNEFSLEQNYPNPFNPSTTISFTVGKESLVRLAVYDALGRKVATLVDKELHPGTYASRFNANEFASGVYYYTLSGEGISMTKKMLLMK